MRWDDGRGRSSVLVGELRPLIGVEAAPDSPWFGSVECFGSALFDDGAFRAQGAAFVCFFVGGLDEVEVIPAAAGGVHAPAG